MPTVPSLVVVVVALARHEAVGMVLPVRTHFRMVLEVLVEAGMSGEEPRVVHQARIVAELLRDFGMLVEVTVVEAADGTSECGRADRADQGYRRQSCDGFFHD